ncbi:MAG TPA: MarR family transcriptional regulator [Kineosporiaceae bacterium]|nr:MarR family transcriptional regulator [Kineosporiaceae bacterium]
MTGQYTLGQTERAVTERLAGLPVDLGAMAAVSNLYRAAGVVRNHFERTVLAEQGLTWTAWVVLWVVWVWEDIETRHAASEAGISKSTLTGVAGTLQNRGLLRRRPYPADGRRVLLSLTPKARQLMEDLFPEFNRHEAQALATLDPQELEVMTRALRKVVQHLEMLDGPEGTGGARAEPPVDVSAG